MFRGCRIVDCIFSTTIFIKCIFVLMYMDELIKEFIVDKNKYEKEKIPELIRRILRYCKITTEGQVLFESDGMTLRDKVKLVLVARFLASKLSDGISEEVSADELLVSISSNNKDSLSARAKEVVDQGVAKRNSRGKYSIIPFYIETILDKLDRKSQEHNAH